jgi:tripartite-type tricarboxylate transporter receptor subunit TctC
MGVPGYEFVAEIGVLAPAGTPAEIIGLLSREISKAVKQADLVQRFAQLGIDPVGSTPEEYAAINRADYEKFARVVKISGVKID